MIEMKGSIVSGCVLSTQESEKKLNKKKKKRKKYVECHLETLPVLPLCRIDYQEYPSSSNVTSTTDTNLPHLFNHSKSLDLYIRQLWNLRVSNYFVTLHKNYIRSVFYNTRTQVLIGQVAAIPVQRPKKQAQSQKESNKDKKSFSPLRSIRSLFRRRSKSESKNDDVDETDEDEIMRYRISHVRGVLTSLFLLITHFPYSNTGTHETCVSSRKQDS